jgi:hypothetical protein
MNNFVPCYACGAPAEIGFPAADGVRWLCAAHAPWQCVGCGPDSGDEDNYAAPDAGEDQEPSQ